MAACDYALIVGSQIALHKEMFTFCHELDRRGHAHYFLSIDLMSAYRQSRSMSVTERRLHSLHLTGFTSLKSSPSNYALPQPSFKGLWMLFSPASSGRLAGCVQSRTSVHVRQLLSISLKKKLLSESLEQQSPFQFCKRKFCPCQKISEVSFGPKLLYVDFCANVFLQSPQKKNCQSCRCESILRHTMYSMHWSDVTILQHWFHFLTKIILQKWNSLQQFPSSKFSCFLSITVRIIKFSQSIVTYQFNKCTKYKCREWYQTLTKNG